MEVLDLPTLGNLAPRVPSAFGFDLPFRVTGPLRGRRGVVDHPRLEVKLRRALGQRQLGAKRAGGNHQRRNGDSAQARLDVFAISKDPSSLKLKWLRGDFATCRLSLSRVA